MATCIRRRSHGSSFRRTLSIKARNETSSKAFSKTLLLPKTAFPQWTDPKEAELPFRTKTTGVLYKWQWENAKGPLFVLHDGPPYANGNLHMGHAMNKIIKDIIIRFQLLQGRRVNYIPGWDCHGLPIEAKTLKEIGREPHSLLPMVIRSAAKSVAEREIRTQCREFQEFGIMANWSDDGTYRTLDKTFEQNQLRVFHRMVEKGLIYRRYRPVYFSPSSRSALAEAELVYRDNHISRSVYVLFRLNALPKSVQSELNVDKLGNGQQTYLLVWTTTPWTLTANMAIAVNPSMEYVVIETSEGKVIVLAKERLSALQSIIGKFDELFTFSGSELVDLHYSPLFPSSPVAPFKIVPASFVSPETGTGIVHCAPAHGAEDYTVLHSLHLFDTHPLLCHVDSEGRYSKDVCDVIGMERGQRLVGLPVLTQGTSVVIEQLKEMGVLLNETSIKHRYPYDWKTDKPVIVTATSQWFADLEGIKDKALTALKDITFFPLESRNRLESFIRSRSEWCISRQRVWGVPIPALYHLPTDQAILTPQSLDYILHILEKKGIDYWWEGPVSEFIPPYILEEFGSKGSDIERDWMKSRDTMDVWFDSGSSWTLLREEGIESESPGHKAYSDVCVEGSDQHRGWFQSLLLTAVSSGDSNQPVTLPYRTLITHGMVLDQEGKKMSKSLGNIMSPMTIVQGGEDKKREPAYGTDVLRFWAASVEFWRDVALGPTVLIQSAEALRKIRNSARFILGNIGHEDSRRHLLRARKEEMSIADRYIMHELFHLENTVLSNYAQFNFPQVVQAISRFTNLTLSALYFDITKDILYANKRESVERRSVVTVLERVLERLIVMIAPITPHLAEEIFYHSQGIGEKEESPSLFTRQWIPMSNNPSLAEWNNEQIECDMHVLLKLRDNVLSLLEKARSDKNLRSSLEAEVDIVIPNSDGVQNIDDFHDVINKYGHFLKTLFIVSDVKIVYEGSLDANNDDWVYTSSFDLSNSPGTSYGIRIHPSSREKCPRCWTYTRLQDATLCGRCSDALSN